MSSNLLKPRLGRAYPEVSHGEGVYLYDSIGLRYLDGSSGAMTANIGHGVAEVADAIAEQARKVAFTFRAQFTSGPAEELAKRICSIVPPPLESVFFVNSGSEATEYAIRAAQQFWREKGRPEKLAVLGRQRSYHGMTMGALSVSGHENRRADYGALLHPLANAPSAHCYRCPFSLSPDSCALECATGWENVIALHGPENIAAVIVEPIVGAAAGAVPSPPGYLKILREICDRHEILLIADEVITGFGRTGDWFAFEAEGIIPDMVLTGKGTSAGYTPMAAVIMTDFIVDAIRDGSTVAPFGHTFSGNPLGAAACIAVLDYVERNQLLANARHAGEQLRIGLESLAQRYSFMADVRGRGLLLGFEMVADRHTRQSLQVPGGAAAMLVGLCEDEGLILYPAGTGELNNAVIVAPPLTIAENEVEDLLDRLNRALAALEYQIPTAD